MSKVDPYLDPKRIEKVAWNPTKVYRYEEV